MLNLDVYLNSKVSKVHKVHKVEKVLSGRRLSKQSTSRKGEGLIQQIIIDVPQDLGGGQVRLMFIGEAVETFYADCREEGQAMWVPIEELDGSAVVSLVEPSEAIGTLSTTPETIPSRQTAPNGL